MQERKIDEVWDQLEIGMEVEHNGDAGGMYSTFQKGTIIDINSSSMTMKMGINSSWYVHKSSGCYIRFKQKINYLSAQYLLVTRDGRLCVGFATNKDHLGEVLEKVGKDVEIIKLEKVRTSIKIEEI